jgi:predicted metal-dependent HD superfamily phosphohydrolase
VQDKNRQRWFDLSVRLDVSFDAKVLLSLLELHYSGRQRFYHRISHIEHCLDEFEPVRGLVVNQDAVEMAIWYHDIVYHPKAVENEEKSARFFAITYRDFLSPDFISIVETLILATKHGNLSGNDDLDVRTFLDIDLTILGQPPATFDKYEGDIRMEYVHFPTDQFKSGRSEILKRFLERKQIYQTEFFRNKYEDQARKNLTRSIEQLSR